VVEYCADICWFQATMDCAVGEQVGRWRGEAESEKAVETAVGDYDGGPELELASAGCEVGLEGVEGWE
jgi:hypothetical protein